MRLQRRTWKVVALLGAALMFSPAVPAAAAPSVPTHDRATHGRPRSYVVSTDRGVLPEGIGMAPDGRTFYVSSSGTGALYRGHVQDPTLEEFAPGGDAGRTSAAGTHVDGRGRIFVVGGSNLDVYRPDGRLVAHRTAPAGPGGEAFLNDLAITATAVYVTDSTNAVVYRVALRGKRIGQVHPWFDARTLRPDYPISYFYLNGVVADPSGRRLLVAAQGIGALIRVDTAHATGAFVDTGATPLGADGLLLRGRRNLLLVLNYEPPSAGTGVYQVRLSRDWQRATRLRRLPDRGLDDPTTVAEDDRHRLLVVNSQLEHAPGQPPYTVSVLPR